MAVTAGGVGKEAPREATPLEIGRPVALVGKASVEAPPLEIDAVERQGAWGRR